MGSPFWKRIIVHVDLDAFFASIEQRDFPHLRGKPIAITNGSSGTCVITRSYEARHFGIKTGMRLKEARKLCPSLIQVPTRPSVYAAISAQIFRVLETISPDMEIFSVDEAFLDLSQCRSIYHSPKQVGKLIKERIYEATRLSCSVGISGDKTTAKYASGCQKPNGLVIIPPWKAREVLAPLAVTELCGISYGIANFLAQYGVHVCGDMQKVPIGLLAQRFGNLGRRLWKMCQAEDPDPVQVQSKEAKSLGHGKILPPQTYNKVVILSYIAHMADKVGRRLRAHNKTAQWFSFAFKTYKGWFSTNLKTILPTADGQLLYKLAYQVFNKLWDGTAVIQCQITAYNPQAMGGQLDLFAEPDKRREELNKIVDAIQKRFGTKSIAHGSCYEPLSTPDVISPAWRPDGVRNSVK
ncbi:MAG TPA: DNA polymerase IV [Coxiellaceae bacterium]|nr:DNA polymerase IV [Coxiellaceae bacterium]